MRLHDNLADAGTSRPATYPAVVAAAAAAEPYPQVRVQRKLVMPQVRRTWGTPHAGDAPPAPHPPHARATVWSTQSPRLERPWH